MCIEAEATILRKGSGVKGGNKALSLSDPTIVANKGKKPRSEGKGKQIVNSRKLPRVIVKIVGKPLMQTLAMYARLSVGQILMRRTRKSGGGAAGA